jgi:hypothetical protein
LGHYTVATHKQKWLYPLSGRALIGLLELEPIGCGGEAKDAEEGSSGFCWRCPSGLVAGGDGTLLSQASPEILDEAAVGVDPGWAGDSRALRWDCRPCAQIPNSRSESVGSQTPITDAPSWHIRQAAKQARRQWQFMRLSGRQRKGDGTPATVCDHAGFGAVAAARAAKRLAPNQSTKTLRATCQPQERQIVP